LLFFRKRRGTRRENWSIGKRGGKRESKSEERGRLSIADGKKRKTLASADGGGENDKGGGMAFTRGEEGKKSWKKKGREMAAPWVLFGQKKEREKNQKVLGILGEGPIKEKGEERWLHLSE